MSEPESSFQGPVFMAGMARSGTKLLRGIIKKMGKYGRRRVRQELQRSFEAPKLLEAYEALFLD